MQARMYRVLKDLTGVGPGGLARAGETYPETEFLQLDRLLAREAIEATEEYADVADPDPERQAEFERQRELHALRTENEQLRKANEEQQAWNEELEKENKSFSDELERLRSSPKGKQKKPPKDNGEPEVHLEPHEPQGE